MILWRCCRSEVFTEGKPTTFRASCGFTRQTRSPRSVTSPGENMCACANSRTMRSATGPRASICWIEDGPLTACEPPTSSTVDHTLGKDLGDDGGPNLLPSAMFLLDIGTTLDIGQHPDSRSSNEPGPSFIRPRNPGACEEFRATGGRRIGFVGSDRRILHIVRAQWRGQDHDIANGHGAAEAGSRVDYRLWHRRISRSDQGQESRGVALG